MTDMETVSEPTTTTILPTPRIDRCIRKAFPGKRVSSGSAVYATAVLEHIFNEVVRSAEAKRSALRKAPKAIDRKMLIAAVRTNPALGKLFRSYTFAANNSIKVKKSALLSKADRDLESKKREDAKTKKKEKQAVPAVDED